VNYLLLGKILKTFQIGKIGRPFALFSYLELRLAKYVIYMYKGGYGLTVFQVRYVAQKHGTTDGINIQKKKNQFGFRKSGICLFNRNASTPKTTASSIFSSINHDKNISEMNKAYFIIVGMETFATFCK
jgi:hypothetical protein